MVGIYRKVKQLLNIVQKYAPILSNIAPGLGEAVGTIADLAEGITDGVNKFMKIIILQRKLIKVTGSLME
jgi:hypothetical protein